MELLDSHNGLFGMSGGFRPGDAYWISIVSFDIFLFNFKRKICGLTGFSIGFG